MKTVAIAGAGFAGAVLAQELARSDRFRIFVFEERNHIGGNCHTRRDSETGILVHEYGPHIFNTSREDVWHYVQRFGRFENYVNRVKAVTSRGVFSLPINLLTINQFFGKRFNPAEAQAFVKSLGDVSIREATNFEEQAVKLVGRDLYEAFFYGYTRKQWGVEPRELPASILQRLPVRFSYDDNYYNQRFQGIPVDGYTEVIRRMLDHPNIRVRVGERLDPSVKEKFDHVFFSGPLDAFFGHSLGRLAYRSLRFESLEGEGDAQGNAVINYCEESVPYTRIAEHKHFAPWENHDKTICFREYSKLAQPGDTLFYPIRLARDKALLAAYVDLADQEENVTFLGRLGTYRYLDMHVVIGESLDLAHSILADVTKRHPWPKFSGPPLPPQSRKAA